MEIKAGDKVNIIIGMSTEIGYKVAVNGIHEGMLYHNEIFQPVEEGQQMHAYVKKVRDDGRIDVNLKPQGFLNVIDIHTSAIIEHLKAGKGTLKLNDKSTPEEIYAALQMSKKSFKTAVGKLYKQGIILIREDGISLVKK